ncbi:hypothetical protein NDU88_012231 [Pleurodeles waltl]|uniref:Uncharacterized protein n=1 Tax=Pleurodeles waltl TaxID=8319 RepID=A0AAV7R5A0_PLEWA|nr:hypothetical protein NDU88_012231 [Pleurodeles waltl]
MEKRQAGSRIQTHPLWDTGWRRGSEPTWPGDGRRRMICSGPRVHEEGPERKRGLKKARAAVVIWRWWEAQRARRITELEVDIVELECCAGWPGGEDSRRLLELRCMEFRQVSLVEAPQHWQASTQRVYELGDKTRKLLTGLQLVTSRPEWCSLSGIGGAAQEDLQVIAHTFTSYYECLYARVPQPTVERENPILAQLRRLPHYIQHFIVISRPTPSTGHLKSTLRLREHLPPQRLAPSHDPSPAELGIDRCHLQNGPSTTDLEL